MPTPFHNDRPVTAPNYARVAADLSDADLEDEILQKRGDSDYQAALLAEFETRARAAREGKT